MFRKELEQMHGNYLSSLFKVENDSGVADGEKTAECREPVGWKRYRGPCMQSPDSFSAQNDWSYLAESKYEIPQVEIDPQMAL